MQMMMLKLLVTLEFENQPEEFSQEVELMYVDVRIRKRINKSTC